jgi:hypothetical protein
MSIIIRRVCFLIEVCEILNSINCGAQRESVGKGSSFSKPQISQIDKKNPKP